MRGLRAVQNLRMVCMEMPNLSADILIANMHIVQIRKTELKKQRTKEPERK